MADLKTALDAALRDRFGVAGVKTPATQRRGLIARMNQLEKLHTRRGDRPGAAGRRAAAAAGIAPDTWTRWKKGQRKPSAASLRKLETAYKDQVVTPKMRRSIRAKKVPDRATITATIRWTDSGKKKYNTTPYRTVKFTGMRPVMGAVIRAWHHEGPQQAADTLERGISDAYSVPDDADEGPGIRFEGNRVQIEFP